MKTNDLKKGMRVQLRNGWEATIADNARGNTRMATVEGFETETGSVYSHDIMRVKLPDEAQISPGFTLWANIEHTPAQIKLRSIAG